MSKAPVYARNLAANWGGHADGRRAEGQRLRILVTMVSGGMLWQARSLLERLGNGHDYVLVTAPDDRRTVQSHFPDVSLNLVPFPSSSGLRSLRDKLLAPVASLWRSGLLVRRFRPDVVLCVSTCLALPLFFWGRLWGARTVYVESATRVTKLSRTGWLVLRLRLASRFYVQWPALARIHTGALFRGSVL